MNFLVIEDHHVVAHALIQLLSQHWQSSKFSHSHNIVDAIEKVTKETFDLIVLDLTLPDAKGTESVVKLIRLTQTPILVMSFHEEAAYARRVIMLGAFGYISKEAMPSVIIEAIEKIISGRKYVSPWLSDNMVNDLADGHASHLPHETLSKQEYRILIKIANGESPSQIALSMDLSARTIGTYRARLLAKLGLKENMSLVKYCLKHNLN